MPRRRSDGGSTFAEAPERAAPEARIIWDASLDPGTLRVVAMSTTPSDPDGIVLADLDRWLTIAVGGDGHEHCVLSDGWHHIRIDVEEGSLSGRAAVRLQYAMSGTRSAERQTLPLRQLLHLCRYRAFSRSLFPHDRRVARWIRALRVHDALVDGASQREIAATLFGAARANEAWQGGSDSLRLRVRRLAGLARRLATGSWRSLMTGSGEREDRVDEL